MLRIYNFCSKNGNPVDRFNFGSSVSLHIPSEINGTAVKHLSRSDHEDTYKPSSRKVSFATEMFFARNTDDGAVMMMADTINVSNDFEGFIIIAKGGNILVKPTKGLVSAYGFTVDTHGEPTEGATDNVINTGVISSLLEKSGVLRIDAEEWYTYVMSEVSFSVDRGSLELVSVRVIQGGYLTGEGHRLADCPWEVANNDIRARKMDKYGKAGWKLFTEEEKHEVIYQSSFYKAMTLTNDITRQRNQASLKSLSENDAKKSAEKANNAAHFARKNSAKKAASKITSSKSNEALFNQYLQAAMQGNLKED